MDKYLSGLKRKFNEEEEAGTSKDNVNSENTYTKSSIPKQRKYDSNYLSLGFTSKIINDQERPMCLLCMNILAADSMKPNKLKRHLEKVHPDHVGKPKEFFERKLESLTKQQQTFTKTMSVTSKALLASYKVSYRIAKCKKPHSIGETLVLPAAIDMVTTMFGESYADQLKMIPLADNTVGRRIYDISEDICDQLIELVKPSFFALQVDEATDVVKDAHLITYIRYVVGTEVREDLLFCKPIEGNSTASEIFKMIDTFLKEKDIPWENCIGLCTDGAPSMAGKNAGLQALVRKVSPHVMWTHCMIHRQSLVSKDLCEDLLTVFEVITKVINFIKNSPLRGRLFGKLCDDMGAEYRSLLYYCEARWLSRSKVLRRVYELREEIAIFLTDNNRAEANVFYDQKFVVKLAYLVDIFEKLATLNTSMQGPNVHILMQKDKITAFMRKIELWITNLQSDNFDMFPNFKATCPPDEIEESKIVINTHLSNLRKQFLFYFEDTDTSKYEWIRNPFVIEKFDAFDLSTAEKEMIIDLSCDSTLKQIFQQENNITTFWLRVKKDFPVLTNKALKILLPFVTSYLCETGFSAVAVLKTKYRSRLVIENELRTAISTIIPRFERICAGKQAHPSHH